MCKQLRQMIRSRDGIIAELQQQKAKEMTSKWAERAKVIDNIRSLEEVSSSYKQTLRKRESRGEKESELDKLRALSNKVDNDIVRSRDSFLSQSSQHDRLITGIELKIENEYKKISLLLQFSDIYALIITILEVSGKYQFYYHPRNNLSAFDGGDNNQKYDSQNKKSVHNFINDNVDGKYHESFMSLLDTPDIFMAQLFDKIDNDEDLDVPYLSLMLGLFRKQLLAEKANSFLGKINRVVSDVEEQIDDSESSSEIGNIFSKVRLSLSAINNERSNYSDDEAVLCSGVGLDSESFLSSEQLSI